MHWIALIAWGGALAVALVVLGFCAYEIVWKANRLRADLARLQAVQGELQRVGAELSTATQRLASVRLLRS
ncbi:MAG: hypothetical protein QOE97_456 [Pseudonocardiales bacterium]|nr:hypothetical protein [Pseudonocardiales bacterium]